MNVPLKYNTRHVIRRWRSTFMTIFTIGLVVAVFVAMLSIAQGLAEAFQVTGDPTNVLVMRKGSTSETNSTVSRDEYRVARLLPGIALDVDGDPLCAGETINIVSLPRVTGTSGNAVIRGVMPQSLEIRDSVKLVEGRMYEPGLRELVVGNGASNRFLKAKVGDRVRLAKSEWKIVGRFDAGRSAFASEFWGDVDLLNQEFERVYYSSLIIKAPAVGDVDTIIREIDSNQRLANVKGRGEIGYYAEQTKSAAPIRFLGMFISITMSVGAVFAAMNTMYASVSGRAWEIATLRVIGFTRRSILLSFMIESVLLGVLGGAVGCLLALPLNGFSSGMTSFASFAEIAFAFRITPGLMIAGIVFAATISLVGGFFPALQASRKPIVESLREGG